MSGYTSSAFLPRCAMRLRPYLPNSSNHLALVSLNDKRPFRAYWPLRLTQIVGGKTWSLSIVRYASATPVLTGDDTSTQARVTSA